MPTSTAKDLIREEARAAALRFSDVNDACPYPFETEAGKVFKEAFAEARAQADSTGGKA